MVENKEIVDLLVYRFFTPFFGLIKKSPYIRRIKTMRRECFY